MNTNVVGTGVLVLTVVVVLLTGRYLFSKDQAAIDEMMARLDAPLSDSAASGLTPYSSGTALSKAAHRSVRTTTTASAADNAASGAGKSAGLIKTTSETDAKTSKNSSPDASIASSSYANKNAAPKNRKPAENADLANSLHAGQNEQEAPADTLDDPLDDEQSSISGRVLNELGEPVSGIEIIATLKQLFQAQEQTLSFQLGSAWTARSNYDGLFAFNQLADGEYGLRTVATPTYPTTSTTVRTGSNAVNLVLANLWELPIHGTVKSTEDIVLAGVVVAPVGQGGKTVVTDKQGKYETTLSIKLNQRGQEIRFHKKKYMSKHLKITETDWKETTSVQFDVVMEPAQLAIVTGSVRSSADEPVADESIQLYSQQTKGQYRAATNQEGKFLIEDVAVANDYKLHIRPKAKYKDHEEGSLQITTDGVHLDIVLESLAVGTLTGQIVDIDGNPIPNFSIWMRSIDARAQSFEVISNEEGHYLVENVPEGKLYFETRSYPLLNLTGLHLVADSETHADLVVDWGGHELKGQVVDSRGIPLSVPEVLLSWSHSADGISSTSRRKTATDTDGFFNFTNLGPGIHAVTISTPGFKGTSFEHEVGSNDGEIVMQLEELNQ